MLNADRIRERGREYRKKNRDRIREQKRIWAQKNRHLVRSSRRNRFQSDPKARLANNMRTSLRRYLTQNKKNGRRSFEIIGCSKEELMSHLESKFRDGMTWQNYGSYWHVDHIVPLSSAKDTDEVLRLCHWTNLQPLTAFENISKGARIFA